MGYRHIDNLYKNQMIFLFKEVYALEKIHGTSAHIRFKKIAVPADVEKPEENLLDKVQEKVEIGFFAGGASHEQFVALFNKEDLEARFRAMPFEQLTVYGEAYGGKMQGMSKTYGPTLRFIAFEIHCGDKWFSVEKADHFVKELGLEFVPYARVPATIEAVDAERDRDSIVAIQNGMGPGHIREGVVLRPLVEFCHQGENGGVIRVKHKRDEFKETNTKREVKEIDPNYLKVLEDADLVAEEWTTKMRLEHVLDHLKAETPEVELKDIGLDRVIPAMLEDVERESVGEAVIGKETKRAITKKTVALYKEKQFELNKQ